MGITKNYIGSLYAYITPWRRGITFLLSLFYDEGEIMAFFLSSFAGKPVNFGQLQVKF